MSKYVYENTLFLLAGGKFSRNCINLFHKLIKGSVDQSVAPETTASGSQGRLKVQSPHGRRIGQSSPVTLTTNQMEDMSLRRNGSK